MSTLKKKNRKMDPYTVSNQPWEIQWVASKFDVKPALVRKVKKDLKTKSRQKIYNEIRRRNAA